MFLGRCLKCGSTEYELKNSYLYTKDKKRPFFYASELFYLKICCDCGFSELYNAKVVDKNVENNRINI